MDIRADEVLVHEVQEGSILAFETLVKRYEQRLVSFIYRILKNEFDAQEVVQDTFFKVYTTIERVNISRRFSSYLFEIAKNTAFSRLRKTHQNLPLDNNLTLETDELVYDGLARKEQAEAVKKAINTLAMKYRNVIKLYYFEDLSYEEISRKLRLPINTVRTHLARAKTALRQRLEYEKS